MFAYYLKIAFKALWSNKKYSTINIVGFSFALSIFLAIILFVIHESTYDRYHANGDQIFRLIDSERNDSEIDYRTKDILLNHYSEIKNACLYQQVSSNMQVTIDGTGYYVKPVASVDQAFFEMFDVTFIKGNSKIPFSNINSIILTESTAKMLFHEENPLGKELIFRDIPWIVSAVVRDFPINSIFGPKMIVNAENEKSKFSMSCQDCRDKSSYKYYFAIYLQLHNQENASSLITEINNNIDLIKGNVEKAGLLPLHSLYLYDKTNGNDSKRGNPSLLKLLLSIALVVIVLAIINYTNLTVAQQQKRGKEIGIRKTIGATRQNLIYQFLTESMIIVFIAFGISLILLELLLPFFSQVFGVPISISILLAFPYNLVLSFAVVLLGIITGLWPAILFSSFNPIQIFSGKKFDTSRRSCARNALTIFQFVVSIALIFSVIIIWKQIEFAKQEDLGFNKEQLLRIDVPRIPETKINVAVGFINKLRDHAYITDLSITNGVPGRINTAMSANIDKDKNEGISAIRADTSFIKTFGLNILQGRDFLGGDINKSCMVNEAFMEYFEWDNFENKRFNNGMPDGFEIIGVLENFHISSMHDAIKPVVVLLTNPDPREITVKISGSMIGDTMNFIRENWKEDLSEYPLNYEFYDEWFNGLYQKEEHFGEIIGFFAILAISISSIGILGLAIFTSERRTKEIGIRKVNGASVENIFILMTREFTLLVIIAFFIASPLAFVFMDNWLQEFAFRTNISWWIFALSGLTALMIAWLTVGWQSLKAALTNPVDALRYE